MLLVPETVLWNVSLLLRKPVFHPDLRCWKTHLCAKILNILYITWNHVLKHAHFFLLVCLIPKWKILLWFYSVILHLHFQRVLWKTVFPSVVTACWVSVTPLKLRVLRGVLTFRPHGRRESAVCPRVLLLPFLSSLYTPNSWIVFFHCLFSFFQQCGHLACLTVLTCQVKKTNISYLTWVCVVSVKHIAFICLFKHVRKENWKAFF